MSWCDTGAYLRDRSWVCDCGHGSPGWRTVCSKCGLKDSERKCEQ